jgi:hypothetical protein
MSYEKVQRDRADYNPHLRRLTRGAILSTSDWRNCYTTLQQSRSRKKHWKRWGPYLSEHAWGTVREDYSADGFEILFAQTERKSDTFNL